MITIDHVEIVRWKPVNLPGEHSDFVANFDALVGPFRIKDGRIRRRHSDGSYFAIIPGRGPSGASIQKGINMIPGAARRWVEDQIVEAYECQKQA